MAHTRTVMFIVALVAVSSSAGADSPTLGDKVANFCKSKIGEKVDDGECSTYRIKDLNNGCESIGGRGLTSILRASRAEARG